MTKRKRRAPRAKPETSPVLRAERYEVLDPRGQAVAVLGPVPGTDPTRPGTGLILFDEHGTRRLLLSVDASGPSLHFTAEGTVLFSLGVLEPEPGSTTPSTFLAARNGHGQEVLSIQVTADGACTLHLDAGWETPPAPRER